MVRRYRDFAAWRTRCEALIAAAQQWPRDGRPDNPRGWLVQVASRRMVDQVRSDSARRQQEHAAALDIGQVVAAASVESRAEEDETLTLLFMCCHPSLTTASAVALTLRAVGGLTTAQIANAFSFPRPRWRSGSAAPSRRFAPRARLRLLPRRGTRRTARRSIHVLYLIFNEGYTASVGSSLLQVDLSAEAVASPEASTGWRRTTTEAAGLLALMILTDARRNARGGPAGGLIPLQHQDRSRWDRAAIDEGVALLTATLGRARVGPYQLQAAVAAVHDEAMRYADTDWPQILALYTLLERMQNNPMVTLNRAIAVAMVQGPSAGSRSSTRLPPRAAGGNHRLDAVRGHLFELAGDRDSAVRHYLAAANRTTNTAERHYLLTQAATVREDGSRP